MSATEQLNTIFQAIDNVNQQDPNKEEANGAEHPKELLYGQRMTAEQQKFCPDASIELQIACRAQHIKRWAIPRKDYPMDRAGYKRWRTELGRFHADTTVALMQENGFDSDSCDRVHSLLQKKQLKRDLEAQALEDVICLVFLQYYLVPFAAKHEEPKLISIIQKTWNKMSEAGHQAALALPLPDDMGALVGKALNP